jgi:hypothetical protein
MFPYYAAPSSIHGVGAFASRHYRRGEEIPFDLDKDIPPGYRGFNHSRTPNLKLVRTTIPSGPHRGLETNRLIVIRHIAKDEEITVNYRFDPTREKVPDWA